MSIALGLYREVMRAAANVGIPAMVLRGRVQERRERCGESPAGGKPAPLWIHAASLGEMAAAGNLLRALRTTSATRVALSATTRAGKARAESLHPDAGPFFLPLDAPAFVKRSLDRVQPSAFVVLETEIWPVLLDELVRRNIPWAMASARISRRSHRRYALIRSSMRTVLKNAAAIAARTPDDAMRFLDLGARPESVRVTGDLKESREVVAYAPPPEGRFRWIAACTRPGEEEIVLEAARLVGERSPGIEAWIAPRHAERFEEVAGRLSKSGLPWRRWSERKAAHNGEASVLLVDEIGVLEEAYRESFCAFIGGSLFPFGGHNPLEAAAAGRPILIGPHTENCAAAAEGLVAGGAARLVTSAAELAQEIMALADDPALRDRRGRAAHGYAAKSKSAAGDTLAFFREKGVIS